MKKTLGSSAKEKGIARYIDEYVIEEGLSRFQLDKPIIVVCKIKEPHFLKVTEVFESKEKKGTFAFCRVHSEFLNISA